jgi:hypothetical protein
MSKHSWSTVTTLANGAGSIPFNYGAADSLIPDPSRCTGLGMNAVRAAIYDRGQAHGFLLGEFFEEGKKIVLAGDVDVTSSSTEAGIVTARDTLLTLVETVLRSSLASADPMTLTIGGDTLTGFRCWLPSDPAAAWHKQFTFGIVREDR